MEFIFEFLVSASSNELFRRLSAQNLIDFNRRKTFANLLSKLKMLLVSVNVVLDDAERRQLGDAVVRKWLDELKEVSYDAGKAIDDLNTSALEAESNPSWGFFNTVVRVFDTVTQPKMKEILERLQLIVEQKVVLGLRESVRVGSGRPGKGLPAGEESPVYGRQGDKEAIIEMLKKARPRVIPIVGMAGIGKTTLAQLVYDDEGVRGDFKNRAWVHVSDEFDACRITRTLLRSVGKIGSHRVEIGDDLYGLQARLKEALRGKKWLIVLDDVWNENYMFWDLLKAPFGSCGHGTKIIVTTRSEIVAEITGNVPAHRLKPLLVEDSWSLFAMHAFENADEATRLRLEAVGKAIVDKCKGLPLAVKSLAGLLRSELDPEKWEAILRSHIWELSEKDKNILPALWLSYYHLPPHLKQCFAYCAIFPKGYELEKENLTLLWMAEDLLPTRTGKSPEDVGGEFFEALVSRSLIQKSLCGNRLVFTMHDLVNDLATFLSGKFCLRMDGNDADARASKARHVAYVNREILPQELSFFDTALRTFLPLKSKMQDLPTRIEFALAKISKEGSGLRAISLRHYRETNLPDSIGNLKHLRYLDLSFSKITKLHEKVCSLYNLQTLLLNHCESLTDLPSGISKLKRLRHLDLSWTGFKLVPCKICDLHDLQKLSLSNCKNLEKLPDEIGNMINLRHLDISCTDSLRGMPSGMHGMKSLKILSRYVLAENASALDDFGRLQGLGGSLEISGLQHLSRDRADLAKVNASMAKLQDKNLAVLSLIWSAENRSLDSGQVDKDVLTFLQPSKFLKELTIAAYRGQGFPKWLEDRSFLSLVSLILRDCSKCCSLPALGQLPALKQLGIYGFHELQTIGREFLFGGPDSSVDPFRSLQVFYIEDMPMWKEWSLHEDETYVFPKLDEFYMLDCKLTEAELPSHQLKRLYRTSSHRREN